MTCGGTNPGHWHKGDPDEKRPQKVTIPAQEPGREPGRQPSPQSPGAPGIENPGGSPVTAPAQPFTQPVRT